MAALPTPTVVCTPIFGFEKQVTLGHTVCLCVQRSKQNCLSGVDKTQHPSVGVAYSDSVCFLKCVFILKQIIPINVNLWRISHPALLAGRNENESQLIYWQTRID